MAVFHGYVAEISREGDPAGYGDTPVTSATILLIEEGTEGPEWIAVWGPDLWTGHPNGAPGRGDGVKVTSHGEGDGLRHDIEWTPRVFEPWSDELLARLRAETKESGDG